MNRLKTADCIFLYTFLFNYHINTISLPTYSGSINSPCHFPLILVAKKKHFYSPCFSKTPIQFIFHFPNTVSPRETNVNISKLFNLKINISVNFFFTPQQRCKQSEHKTLKDSQSDVCYIPAVHCTAKAHDSKSGR
jgi:hypothetical protein